jgi:alanyl-tRNA synthetase
VDSKNVRQAFLDFFASKQHRIVPSAPMVVKDDPTLMFTNAGMNQFKDFFLGYRQPTALRIADTQKCLRVSGKHNDLEEVGRDSYHHTMFEMLGNWSFGDYFKEEAIAWAWELLTNIYGLKQDRLYITVFGGDPEEQLAADAEARKFWTTWISNDRILDFGKKDNFWEMGESGPCGPCSEIHYDLRSDDERARNPGDRLVNTGDPEVVELWNLVFIQFNRKADGSLEPLPQKHVDTGMGFERVTRALQNKTSNYDTDIFEPYLHFISQATGIDYTNDYSGKSQSDIAMRVIADHVRALFFGIADGQLPSNTGAGYVLRRILRRAVRYYYSFLKVKAPLMYRLVPLLADYFSGVFPDATGQADFIGKVIREEESAFLRTLDAGIHRFNALSVNNGVISGRDAFELYDTYGFPFDLTQLMAAERGHRVDIPGFDKALADQKARSREDAQRTLGDWVMLNEGTTEFVGYEQHKVEGVRMLKYREVNTKGNTLYHVVLDKTPFYPEGGGQVGDTGTLMLNGTRIQVLDTIKENELPILVVDRIPSQAQGTWTAQIDTDKRLHTENNHSATHLLHAALRKVLGIHVQQKGSLVNDKYLRFDFSHFQKMTAEEIQAVEKLVNEKIRDNVARKEDKLPIEQAKAAGAMMLFGEKYGDVVRMITFDPAYSIELCGGCHVSNTGKIGLFKIISESAIAAGVRRIEAVTADAAEEFVNEKLHRLEEISSLLKHPADVITGVTSLLDENKQLRKQLQDLQLKQVSVLEKELYAQAETVGNVSLIAGEVSLTDGKAIKDLVFRLTSSITNAVVFIGSIDNEKVQLHLGISKQLVDAGLIDASKIIRELSKYVKGGGGGQAFYASAGGSDPSGLSAAMSQLKTFVEQISKSELKDTSKHK